MAQKTFATYGPTAKLVIWLGSVALIAGAIELLSRLFGLDFHILSPSGSALLTVLGLGGLVMVMAFDPRPLADYGLVAQKNWARHFFIAFVIGFVGLSLYFWLVWQTGAMRVPTNWSRALGRLPKAIFSGSYAFMLAPIVQIIFCGYLLGLLKQGYNRYVAIVLVACLFSFLYGLSRSQELAAVFAQFQTDDARVIRDAAEWRNRFIGFALMLTLTSLMRLVHGHIFIGAGVLAGWIAALRFIRKLDIILAAAPEDKWLVKWLIPFGDVRQAPVLWGFILIAIAYYGFLLWKRGEAVVAEVPKQMDTSFKRIYPLAQTNMFAPLDLWLGRLFDARFRIGLVYWPRFICCMIISAINTLLTLPERLLAPLMIRWHKVPDPVFIVGVHRSGTTHLHNLLSLDDRMVAPRLYHVMNPLGCLFTGWLWLPVLACTPNRRPMDNVRLHAFSANEEEFALANMCSASPYWGFVFPRKGAEYDRFNDPQQFTESKLKRWRSCYIGFLRRLTFFNHKRPLLKNPVNTGRVAALKQMFPKARFIHIRRHPYDVYRSNIHLAQQGIILYQLQDQPADDSYCTRFPDNFVKMEQAYERDAAELLDDQVVDLRFEDLEQDPVGVIQQIYQTLDMEFTESFGRRLHAYLDGLGSYKKNSYQAMDPQLAASLGPKFNELFDRGAYEAEPQASNESP